MAGKSLPNARNIVLLAMRCGHSFEFGYALYLLLCISSALDVHDNRALLPVDVTILAICALFALLVFSDGCMRLWRDAYDIGLPDFRKALWRGLALMIILSVLLPSLCLWVASRSWNGVCIIVCAGMLGLLLPAVFQFRKWSRPFPAILYAWLFGACTLLALRTIVTHAETLSLSLTALATTLTGMVVWRWHRELNITNVYSLEIAPIVNAPARFSLRYFKRRPTHAVRVFLGELYAPASAGQRIIQLAALSSIVLVPPAVFFIAGATHTVADAIDVWSHTWRPLTLIAGALSWMIFMYESQTTLLRNGFNISELALLPCKATSHQQLAGVLWGWFGMPIMP